MYKYSNKVFVLHYFPPLHTFTHKPLTQSPFLSPLSLQGDRGSVMVCDGRLQGVQWFSHGCSNHDDPSVYTKLCLYNDWINDVMDRYESTLPTETTPGMTTAEGQ